jgi:N6-adenosine-specific RNA methylase IME4
MNDISFHELANIFPLIEGKEFQDLVDDIQANGLSEPILLYEGKILDGRNRYRACLEAFVNPTFQTYSGDNPLAKFISLNLKRRHLDESQRAMVAARIATLPKGANQHSPIGEPSQAEAADMLNVGKRSVERAREVLEEGAPELVSAVERGAVSVSAAADVASFTHEEQREIVARGEKEILEAAKEIRAKKAEASRVERLERIVEISRGNQPLDTTTRYPVILADPPWQYENPPTVAASRFVPYPTMTLDDICALPVGDLATDDAILYLWATAPKLMEAGQVLDAWGFDYRTCFVWVKDKIGLGFFARNQHEMLLVARRGNIPAPSPSALVSSIIEAPRGAHSEKPVQAYEIIEACYPELPKIELFSRKARAGWAAWGNQAEEFVAPAVNPEWPLYFTNGMREPAGPIA